MRLDVLVHADQSLREFVRTEMRLLDVLNDGAESVTFNLLHETQRDRLVHVLGGSVSLESALLRQPFVDRFQLTIVLHGEGGPIKLARQSMSGAFTKDVR